jgi:hypothetical protein
VEIDNSKLCQTEKKGQLTPLLIKNTFEIRQNDSQGKVRIQGNTVKAVIFARFFKSQKNLWRKRV